MAKVTIDGITVEVDNGTTIFHAADQAGIRIPHLCYHPDQSIKGNCRICVVEVEGQRLLQPACAYPVSDGMVVHTNTERVRKARYNILELILAHHPDDCLHCIRNHNCELQQVAADMCFTRDIRFPYHERGKGMDFSSVSITRDPAKCIVCDRCAWACTNFQSCNVLTKVGRGFETYVTTEYDRPMDETACTTCGQCIQACPVAALTIHDDKQDAWDAIANKNLTVVAQVAPAVRVNIAEALGEAPGTISTGRLVTAMKMMGIDYVFDTDFSADLTIMEEGTEFLHRLTDGGCLPLITSCSPGWVKFCETWYPDQLAHLSTAKSPQGMFGALIKAYYSKKLGKQPQEVFSLSVMPCTAKKFEAKRPELGRDGYQDVDCVITVQELAEMIRSANIDFEKLPDTQFDAPFGLGSGAGVIFGASGGVMEAALRTVYEILTGKTLEVIDFKQVRGFRDTREAVITIGDLDVKVCITSGLANARKIMDLVRAGKADYHFIEIMACPGGCIGGGGNPYRDWVKVEKRNAATYIIDAQQCPIRQSHKNPAIQEFYKDIGVGPGEGIAHKLFHTSYTDRGNLPK
ncbi:MAG TPA: NADH-dependent [FeFe] hydrogenase, group A6 [Oscillospiraceae bacterium]|nr:[FeFe] hydrogenase, group A [Oscillospiraceae bacterium]HNW05123.1 NADH-dependent [FeFe] hydrogenase, group A6 [Oscillospiraceae bacterium]